MGSWIRGYLESDHARRRLLSSATAGAVSICQIPQSDTSVTITARASTTIVKRRKKQSQISASTRATGEISDRVGIDSGDYHP
jgi:hypothetical protein